MKEVRDLYDINRNKLEIQNIRGEPIPKNTYILAVHVIIFNSEGQLLIQKRASGVNSYANMWDFTACGCAIKGESSQRAAERELQEELGLFIDLVDQKRENVRPDFTINYDDGFDDFYVITKDINIKNVILQQTEVQDVMWAGIEDVKNMLFKGFFVPYKAGIIDLINSMRFSYGSIERQNTVAVHRGA